MSGPGLKVRLTAIPGVTPRAVLADSIYLPCQLGDFTVDEEFGHTDYLTATGEYSQPEIGGSDSRRLRTTSLETITVDYEAAWVTSPASRMVTSQEVRRALSDIGRSKRAVELVIFTVDWRDELRMNATLRTMSRSIRGPEADARYTTLAVKEWRENSIDRLNASLPAASELPRVHTLTKTDTLYTLADRYGVTSSDWRAIAAANNLSNYPPSALLIKAKGLDEGSKLKIPARDSLGPKGTERGAAQDGSAGSDFTIPEIGSERFYPGAGKK